MLKKTSLLVLCIAINLETHGMLRNTITAFIAKSKTLSEAITFLEKSSFSIINYSSSSGKEKVKLIRRFSRYPHLNNEKTIISISTLGNCFDIEPFNLSIDHEDLSKNDKLIRSNSEKWYNISREELLNLLEKKTPPGPTK